ncbi:ABC transporter ATP-binding protein [Allohahella marinimesophila]|uniref:ABC transporter ATP-binding protein n=1 Tax=Allohahella marinimesophila TaxID=1054972 RepID=A0ABP7Q9X6_9GAMM
MAEEVLVVEDLCKAFEQPDGRLQVVDGVSFRMTAGKSAALTGESGSGKSTLLQLVAGLVQPDAGRIFISGHHLGNMSDAALADFRRRHIGLIFQQFRLIMTLRVMDNIRLMAALNQSVDPEHEAFLIETLELGDQLQKYPAQLSGGQQQRVGIARALNHKPLLILADEPTGSLDSNTSSTVSGLLIELAAGTGAALLTATHSQPLAETHNSIFRLQTGRLDMPTC